ncbi:hypothetical protein [Leptospira meyeri]|uniref:hypothetical protein n=1 Tax=Leptospira meyeri TaxID=29508 RepID=UPI0010846100|nr:hypothetical protein [Leptospira meyeri]TGL15308.1 hypothetical protein EHQ50_05080 [Leptospira meyeri]
MKLIKYFILLLAFLTLSNCESEIANVTGKCEKEKKKSKQCLLSTVLTCENSPEAERYRKLGINICTNVDGYFFMIHTFCDKPVEC